ncbi:carbon-nitrogen hydrolase family protein [bacterium]|nr:carbon-nitrogen hydrolase family protein [bacterium]MCP5461597.1 carbon-nitrogen hydrolase family protein [bacterium]
MHTVGIVQIDSQQIVSDNLSLVIDCIERAAHNNAELVVLPENMLYIGQDKTISFTLQSPEIEAVRTCAQQNSLYILAGSFPEKTTQNKIYNTSIMINPQGNVIASYRKIHLFDAALGNSQEFNESSYTLPGENITAIKTPFGVIGMSICYDVRFPELYRYLAHMGSTIVAVPSNFSLITGKDHWIPLLQARAIENGVYILAPNQCGTKYDGNQSYGRSAIVDPWGTVIACASDTSPSIIYAQIDPAFTERVRRTLPSLGHIRLFNPDA